MTEIPEHLLKRSKELRAQAEGDKVTDADATDAKSADISNEDIFKVLRHHASLFRQVDEILAVLVKGMNDIDSRLDIVERVVAALATQYPIDSNTVAEILAKQANPDTPAPPSTGQYL